jgi:predicted GNAT family acetyltransferase
MRIQEYKSARTFLEAYEALLLEKETASQLLLYVAWQNSQLEETEKNIFGAVIEETDTILLFCNIVPYDLLIYTVKQENTTLASAALADYFGSRLIIIHGIVAEQIVCQGFMEQYKKHIDCGFTQKMGMDILELRELIELKPAEGTYRPALPEEAKLVAEWMIEFQVEALTSEIDYEAALQKAEKQIKEGKIHFYENEERKVVSMAIAARKLAHGTTITYIYTPEEYRGKGFAAANIYYLSKELLAQENEFCSLFVDKQNPLSARAYEKIGYKIIGACYEYTAIPLDKP